MTFCRDSLVSFSTDSSCHDVLDVFGRTLLHDDSHKRRLFDYPIQYVVVFDATFDLSMNRSLDYDFL